jgi:hypothetical protein
MEPNNKTHHINELLIKENEILKKFTKEKIKENETLQSLISLLELQRERIDFLESGNYNLK